MRNQVKITNPWPSDALPPTTEDVQRSPREVGTLAALRRRWRLVVGLVAIPTLLTYPLCQLMTPLYAAKTVVMIDPRKPRPTASNTDQMASPPSEESVRKNEIAIIRSRNLAEAVIARLALDQDPEFNPTLRPASRFHEALDRFEFELASLVPGPLSRPESNEAEFKPPGEQARDKTVDQFIDRLVTTSTDASRVIEIRFLSENPEKAAQIGNTIADQFMRQKRSQEVAGAQSTVQDLDQKIEVLNQTIRESEHIIEKIRNQRGLLPNGNVRVIVEQLLELNKQLAAATGERIAAEGRLAELQSTRGSRRGDSATWVLGSPLIQHLQAEAALTAAQIGDMSATYDAEYPKIVQARAKLRDLRLQIDSEVAKIAESYQNALVAAKTKEGRLRREMGELKAQVAEANASEVDLHALERQAEANRNLLTQLVTRLNEAKAQIELQSADVSVISNATVPRSPSFPPKLAMIAAAFVISAAGGTILAVLLERADGSIRSTAQIRQLTSARVLGAIPMVKGAKADRRLPQSHVLAEPRSLFTESLHSVWFRIINSGADAAKFFLITSSVSGEGKSVLAACLARMLAMTGSRILIIDADMRHPSVHKMFRLHRSPGLAELITGESDATEVLQVDSASSAYVLGAGNPVASPSDILQSPDLPQVLRALCADFDTVIIDSPPVLAVDDASIVAQQADMTIMVVRWGWTKEISVTTALQKMSDLNIPVNGIVLSMVDSTKYGRYGYPDSEIFSRGLRKYYS
jgi:succinoglycan biosynthesis transport protein ExoP